MEFVITHGLDNTLKLFLRKLRLDDTHKLSVISRKKQDDIWRLSYLEVILLPRTLISGLFSHVITSTRRQ